MAFGKIRTRVVWIKNSFSLYLVRTAVTLLGGSQLCETSTMWNLNYVKPRFLT